MLRVQQVNTGNFNRKWTICSVWPVQLSTIFTNQNIYDSLSGVADVTDWFPFVINTQWTISCVPKHKTWKRSRNRLPPMPFNELCIASSLPTLECRLNNKIRREREQVKLKKRDGGEGARGFEFQVCMWINV